MKFVLYPAFFFCVITLTSCGENRSVVHGIETNNEVPSPVFTPAPSPAYTKPLIANDNIVNSTSKPKLNPAHGLPGHRCEISVGAPLPVEALQNASPVATNLPVINPPAQIIPAIQSAAKAPGTEAGLNPAHGQPGHRCDIAVGARLPKGPAQSAGTTPVITNLKDSTLIQAQPGTSAFAAGLNPAHGQDGHRCDIEVGKPLNSAPKKN